MDLVLPAPFTDLLERIEPGTLTTFFGAPGTGKTNLCLLAMLECINTHQGRVTYIDTEGGFSFARLSQLMPTYKTILNRIDLREPKDFTAQGDLIRSLKSTDLVVIDSISALYRLEYSDAEKTKKPAPQIIEANRELSKQLSLLSTFARTHQIPTLVTCHTFRSWDTGRDEIVGGDVVKYWSKGIIFVEKTGRPGERKATIVKHRSLPEGKQVKFVIHHTGIKPAGFKLF